MNPATLVGIGLIVIGALALIVGGILLLVQAFKENILWGLGSIFLPFVGLIFMCMHWDVARRPFFMKLAGIVAVLGGVAVLFFGNGKISF